MGFESRIFISAEQFTMSSSNTSRGTPRGTSKRGDKRIVRGASSDPSDPIPLIQNGRESTLSATGGTEVRCDRSLSPRRCNVVAIGGQTADNDVDVDSSSVKPDELSHQDILQAFDSSVVGCFDHLVASILGFWVLLPLLREKVEPKILKKILGLITDEHKPPLPQDVSRHTSKPLYDAGSRYPHRYNKLLITLKKYGIMGFDLRNPINIIIGLLFGTLNPFLVSELIDHLQKAAITNEDNKTTLVFTLMFLSAVMRNTVLVKKPAQLYDFVKFLLASFKKDDETWLQKISRSAFDEDFIAGITVVGAKVFTDFKSIPIGKPLNEEKLRKFNEEIAEFALPDTDCKTALSQKLSDQEIPDVLAQAYDRHWFALQNIVSRLFLRRDSQLFEFNGKFSTQASYFLFLTLLTSSCRRSSTIFQKELEKVLRALKKAMGKSSKQIKELKLFEEELSVPMSKLFVLIRLVFLDESDSFIEKFFTFDESAETKTIKTENSLRDCFYSLLEKMHETAQFSTPVHDSMKQQLDELFQDVSATEPRRSAAGGGVCANGGHSPHLGTKNKSALKQSSSSPAPASVFTAEALREHTASQSMLAQQLMIIGLTTPDASMALAAKFNEAGVTDLKNDLKGMSKEDVIATLKTVSVTLTPVQLNKLIKHVAEN
jgi:hypothetical protein